MTPTNVVLPVLLLTSMARGDGGVLSDIDLLLVRAPVAGEADPRRKSGDPAEANADGAAGLLATELTERQAAKWERQTSHLHVLVRSWTGNPLQLVEMSAFQWGEHRLQQTVLFREITRDGIQVAGEVLGAAATKTKAR